jgi:VanZ family protein
MNAYRKIFTSLWPAILWSALIFVLMILPGNSIPDEGIFSIPHLDKIVHVIIFAGFVWLWVLYFRNNQKENKGTVFKIVLVAIAYGVLMEYVQKYFIPNRSFDVFDIVADTIGAIVSALVIRNTSRDDKSLQAVKN